MGMLPARFIPNLPIDILQTTCANSSSTSVHLEKLPQFGRSKDFKKHRYVSLPQVCDASVAKIGAAI
jgi:hypothetical protein